MRAAVVIIAMVEVGCLNAGVIDERADNEIEVVRWRTRQLSVAAACSDGATFEDHCGLLTDYVATAAFRSKYEEKRCATVDARACDELLAHDEAAWLHERYFAADRETIARACRDRANGCTSSRAQELLLLSSHNKRLRTLSANEIDAINDRRSSEHLTDFAQTLGAFNSLVPAAK